jgi:hypothetical protein
MSPPPLTRKLTQREQKVRAGHTDICDGVRPFRLRGRPIGGGDHDLLTDINDLQQEIVDEAHGGGGESFARMLEALKANKKLSAEIEGGYFEKYEVGPRGLKDDLSMAILAEEDEQTVDTLGGIFQHLAGALASASPEVKQKAVECLPDEFGVRLAASVDIQTMLVEVDSPRKKNRSWDSPGTAEGSQAKRKESSESNDVASNVNHEDSDDMEGEGEGEDRNAASDDNEPIEITGPLGPISSNTPTPAPAPSPRASRPTVRMLWGLTDPPDTPPGGKKHPRNLPDTAEGSKAKRNKSSETNDVASNVNLQGSDDVECDGEDRNPADDDAEEPNEITRPISSNTPAPAPASTPRVSRTAVNV